MMSRNGMAPSFLFFTVNLMAGLDMFHKVLFMFFLLNDKGVIHMLAKA